MKRRKKNKKIDLKYRDQERREREREKTLNNEK